MTLSGGRLQLFQLTAHSSEEEVQEWLESALGGWILMKEKYLEGMPFQAGHGTALIITRALLSAFLQLRQRVLSLLAKLDSSLNWVVFLRMQLAATKTRAGLGLIWVIPLDGTIKAYAGSLCPHWLVALTVPSCSFGNPVCGPKIHVHLMPQWLKQV